MKRMGKILSLFLTAVMAASCLAGCNNSDENADTSSAGSKPSSSTDYDIYIYNSKGENAEQFKAMCEAYTEETGVKIKQFSIGSGQDHMETLRAEMASKNPPTIFSIQGIKELPEWQESGRALDLSQATDPDFKSLPRRFRKTYTFPRMVQQTMAFLIIWKAMGISWTSR